MEALILIVIVGFYIMGKIIFGNVEDRIVKDLKKFKDGVELVKKKNYEAGITYFEHAIAENPQSAVAFAYRGKCHLKTGNLFLAIADCNRAASLDFNLSEAYLDKGIALYTLGDYKNAYLEFDKAVWYMKKDATAYYWRGIASYQLGDWGTAEKDLKKAVALGDENANHFLLKQGNHKIWK